MSIAWSIGLGVFGLAVGMAGVWYFFLRKNPKKGRIVGEITQDLENSDPAQRNWLLGVQGEVEGKAFHVGSRAITIGRAVTNFIQLGDRNASRVHCSLIPKKGALQVQDLESSGGIFVNGQPVSSQILNDGDQLRIGDTIFEYKATGDYQTAESAGGWNYVGDSTIRKTIGGSEGIDGLAVIIKRYLEEFDGDVEAVAKATQLRVDVIEKYVERD